MCGINASRGQEHGCRFTMCHASLKMALLLHKEGLVKTTVPITADWVESGQFGIAACLAGGFHGVTSTILEIMYICI